MPIGTALRGAALALLVAALPALSAETVPPPADTALSSAPFLPRIGRARDFTLTGTSGNPVRLSGLDGKVRIVDFVYTSCGSACPLLTQRLATLQDRLAAAGEGGRVAFLTVTVDPEHDDQAALDAFAKRHGADLANWSFLTGQPEQVRPVLVAWNEWTQALADGVLDHPARLYLIDRAGYVRDIYSLSFFDERQAFLDIQQLLAEPAS